MSDINFVDAKERELFQEALLGDAVRKFLTEDPVGQYLHHRAKQLVAQAEVDALAVDPDGFRGWFQSRRKLRVIRQRAALGKAIIDVLAEAIANGRNAERELDEYRQ